MNSNNDTDWKSVFFGILAFIFICLLFSWLGDRFGTDYYKGNGSYFEEACSNCDYQ